MPSPHHLLRLPLPTIRRPPKSPLIARADRVQGIPELGCDSRVRRIFNHADALTVLDLPPNLATELKVVALIVDRPRSIGLHQDAMISGCNQLFQSQRLLS